MNRPPLTTVFHLVYAQHGTGADAGDVYYIRSTDSGRDLRAPFKLNSDATTRPQWQPNLSVSPTPARSWPLGTTRATARAAPRATRRSVLQDVLAQVQ